MISVGHRKQSRTQTRGVHRYQQQKGMLGKLSSQHSALGDPCCISGPRSAANPQPWETQTQNSEAFPDNTTRLWGRNFLLELHRISTRWNPAEPHWLQVEYWTLKSSVQGPGLHSQLDSRSFFQRCDQHLPLKGPASVILYSEGKAQRQKNIPIRHQGPTKDVTTICNPTSHRGVTGFWKLGKGISGLPLFIFPLIHSNSYIHNTEPSVSFTS